MCVCVCVRRGRQGSLFRQVLLILEQGGRHTSEGQGEIYVRSGNPLSEDGEGGGGRPLLSPDWAAGIRVEAPR